MPPKVPNSLRHNPQDIDGEEINSQMADLHNMTKEETIKQKHINKVSNELKDDITKEMMGLMIKMITELIEDTNIDLAELDEIIQKMNNQLDKELSP